MKKSFSSQDLLALSVALFVPLIIYVIRPVTPQDYWWYLRLGEEIASTGAVPVIETFSYTQAGQPIVYHSWLSALLFFWLDALGGITVTIFFGMLTIAATYTILWLMMREMGASPLLAGLISLATILPGSMNWSLRPQLFAYPLFAASLWLLWRWQEKDEKKLWLLPFFALIWVNLHGSFVLLFLLAGAALVFGKGERKQLLGVLAAIFLATLINPRGWQVWGYVVNSLLVPSNQSFSREWMPPVNEGWQMNLYFVWHLAFIAVAGFSSRSLSTLEWVWLLGFGWLGLSGLRYGIWFLFIIAPLCAALLVKEKKPDVRPSLPVMDFLLAAILLAFPLALLPNIRNAWWDEAPPALSRNTPVSAVQWLDAQPQLEDPVWADLAFESYLVYALPERPVWIDTRFEVHPPEHWENYKAVNNAAWNWQALLDKDEIKTLMLSQLSQGDLLKAVEASPVWDECYRDDVAVIYARAGGCP